MCDELCQETMVLDQSLGFAFDFQAYRLFTHDVTTAILVSQSNETTAMLVSKANYVGVELFPYVNNSLVPINLHNRLTTM